MLEQHPETVKIVHKNYPLQTHRFSGLASLASYAAQQQGKFWQYHDLIFENFKHLTPDSFKQFAQELHLNLPQFEKQMNSDEARQFVTDDFQNAREAGVTGTPAIFINGRIVRNRSLENINKIIAEELK